MTDNEIVKALECCSEANNCGKCEYEATEHQIGTVGCCNELMKDARDLINHLQAENKRLSTLAELGNTRANDYRVMRDRTLKAEAENDTLKNVIKNTFLEKAGCNIDPLAEIKAEAYKEFAERLHEELRIYGIKDKFNKSVFLNVVDKAKKELVGDEK